MPIRHITLSIPEASIVEKPSKDAPGGTITAAAFQSSISVMRESFRTAALMPRLK